MIIGETSKESLLNHKIDYIMISPRFPMYDYCLDDVIFFFRCPLCSVSYCDDQGQKNFDHIFLSHVESSNAGTPSRHQLLAAYYQRSKIII
jgi:hypothetical protein